MKKQTQPHESRRHTLRAVIGIGLLGALVVQGCSPAHVRDPGAPNPKAQAAFERGSTALESGRYSAAIPELYTVLDEHPTHVMARYNLGVALLRVKQYKETVDVLTASNEPVVSRQKLQDGVRVPFDVDADYLHALGTAYQEQRDFKKSLVCYEAAIQLNVAHLKSYYARALTLEAQGEWVVARAAWVDYLSRDPDSAWGDGARKHLAVVERRLRDLEVESP